MSKILFAMATVLTSQGWFEPATLLPQHDLAEGEEEKLVEEKKAAAAEHDSPLAARVHELAKHHEKHNVPELLKHAVESLSPESAGDEPVEFDEAFVDPTPEGEFPTLKTFLAVGYKAENYEGQKKSFYEDKEQSVKAAEKVAEAKAAEAKAAEAKAAEASATESTTT